MENSGNNEDKPASRGPRKSYINEYGEIVRKNYMEPKSENKPITVEDARKKGLERINRLLNFVAPAFAPGLLAEAEVNVVKEKWEKSEKKKQLDGFIEKSGNALRRLGRRIEQFDDRLNLVTDQIAKRGVLLGLKPVVGAESGFKWFVADFPEAIRDFIDSRREQKQEKHRAIIKKIEAKRDQGYLNRKKDRERGRKITVARTLTEKIQTKG